MKERSRGRERRRMGGGGGGGEWGGGKGEGLEKLGRRRMGEELRQRHREEARPLRWDLETLSQSQRASSLIPTEINAI